MTSYSPPGPGAWRRDAAHFPRRVSPIAADLYSAAFPAGFAEGTARFGSTLDRLLYACVDGWMYNQALPFGGAPGQKAPPNAILWVATRLLPAFRARARAAARPPEALWREDLRAWEEEIKPARIRAHRALLAEDLGALGDEALAGHARRALDLYADSVRLHGRYSLSAFYPVGDLAEQAAGWTGLARGEIAAALRGSSPISAGEEPCAAALLRALAEDPAAREKVASDADPGRILAELAALPAPTGPAVREWLDTVGERTLDSYDILQPRGRELPGVLLGALREALAGRRPAAGGAEASIAALRERVPPERRADFDAMLAEAQACMRLRDERVLYNDYWSAGVLRRALLEVGRRAADRGLLAAPEHATVARLAEIEGLLAGREPAEDLGDRYARCQDAEEPPEALGPPADPPPPAEVFPAALRRGHRAALACLALAFDEHDAPDEPGAVRGFGVSPGIVEGTARVVLSAADFGRIQPGDILVARSTSPTYNTILPLLGGIVTDRGGALCHAAIVAREFGIPGIVGSRRATAAIPDGARVRVDGGRGEARVLGPA